MASGELRFNVIAQAQLAALEKAAAALDRIESKLNSLDRQTANPRVDVDTKKAEADIGNFARNLQTKLQSAIRALPKINIEADAGAAEAEIAQIRSELQALADKRIGIDIDAGAATAKMAELQAQLERLSATSANIQIRADTGKAAADLAAIQAEALATESTLRNIDQNVDSINTRMQTWRLMVAGVAAAFPAVSAAVVAIPGLLALAIVPIAAIAAGIDGISIAMVPLMDTLERIQGLTTAAFAEGLQPALGNILQLGDGLAELLGETASALSQIANEVTAVLASESGMDALFASFNNINDLLFGLAPGLALFTENMLNLMQAGTEGMKPFSAMFEQVAATWQRVIADMGTTDTVQRAITGLLQVLAALLELLAPLVQLGAQLMAVIGPPLAAAISGVTQVLLPLVSAFGQLPQVLQTVIVAAAGFRLAMSLLAKKEAKEAADALTRTGQAAQTAAGQTEQAAGRMDRFKQSLAEIGAAYQMGASRGVEFGQRVAEGANTAAAALSTNLVGATNRAAQAMEVLPRTVEAAGGRVAQAFGVLPGLVESAGARIAGAMTTAGGAVTNWRNTVANAMNAMGDALLTLPSKVEQGMTAVGAAVNRGVQLVETGIRSAASAVSSGWDAAIAGTQRAGQAIVTAWGSAITGVQNAGRMINAAFDATIAAGQRVGPAVGAGMNALERGVMTAATGVTNAMRVMENGIVRLPQLFDAVPAAIRSGFQAIPGLVQGASNSIANALRTIPSAVTSASTSVASGMRSLGSAIQSGLISAVQAIPTVVNSATTGLTRFASVASGVASAGARTLASGLNGLVGALGGPAGAAITAVTVGLSLLGQKQQEAAQKAAEHNAAVQQFASILQSSGGAISARVQAFAAVQAEESGLLQTTKNLGISEQELVNAITQGGAAFDSVKAKTEALKGPTDSLINSWQQGNVAQQALASVFGFTNPLLAQHAQAASATGNALDEMRSRIVQAEESEKRLSAATQSAAQSMEPMVSGLDKSNRQMELTANAMANLSDATKSTEDKIKSLGSAFLNSTDPQATFTQVSQQANDSLRKFNEEVGKVPPGLVAADGTINSTTEAGSKLATAMLEGRAQMSNMAGAATTLAQANGEGAAAFAKGALAASDHRDKLLALAQQAGLSATDIQRLKDGLLQIPPSITTQLSTPGALEALANMMGLKIAATDVPNDKEVRVSAPLAPEVIAKLQSLGLQVVQIPGTKEVVVSAKTDQFVAGMQTVITMANGQTATVTLTAKDNATGIINGTVQFANGQTGTITIDGNQQPVDGKITATVTRADGSTGTIKIDGNDVPVNTKTDGAKGKADTTTGTITLNGNDADVMSKINHVINTAWTTTISLVGRLIFGGAEGMIVPAGFAEGGINYFAKGGQQLSPMRGGQAKAVQPNTWRVIGDNAKVTESYIPWNNSKRSKALLATTAKAMGYGLVPMASGGLAGAAQEVLDRMNSGQRVLEDFTFKGASANVLQYNDQLVSLYKASGRGPITHAGDIAFLQSVIGGSSPTGGVTGSITRGGDFAISKAVGTPVASAAGGSSGGGCDLSSVTTRIDKLTDLIQRRGLGTNITVEDRSGDPHQTARETRLALRLS